MDSPTLSILCACIPEREEQATQLEEEIRRQANGYPVEVIFTMKPKRIHGGMSIPQRRNELYRLANGKFSVQLDDDDFISHDYIKQILKAYKETRRDCITYDVKCNEGNGVVTRAKISIRYKKWNHLDMPDENGYKYYQSPYYKVPIRTKICRKVPFNESLKWGEDADFARRILPLLETECHIPEELYIYNFPDVTNGPIDPMKRY